MNQITNTARSTPAAVGERILAEARRGNNTGAIERMEAAGQRELVNSDRLPSKMGDQAEYEALGFTFGPVDESDPLFRPATLPPGWRREGSDHAMWSYLHDEHGRQRVGIFYKAAFYDRRADMHLISLDWYVTQAVEYDGPALIFDDTWATREAVLAAMRESRDYLLKEAGEFREYAADERSRDEKNRAGCAEIAAEKEEKAAKYEAAMKALGPDA